MEFVLARCDPAEVHEPDALHAAGQDRQQDERLEPGRDGDRQGDPRQPEQDRVGNEARDQFAGFPRQQARSPALGRSAGAGW